MNKLHVYPNNNLSNFQSKNAKLEIGKVDDGPYMYLINKITNSLLMLRMNEKDKSIAVNAQVNGAWGPEKMLATKDDLDSKLELVTTDYLPLTAATINPNSYTNFIFNPSLPSGYILVGACLKDTRQLAQKVAPLYCSASTSNGTHRINFRLANTSDDPVSITESMGVAFYLFVRKR